MWNVNAVKKSLFDKNIDSSTYNPNIVINEQSKNIKDKIKELLNKSTRVDIAVSYVVWSGLSLIYEDLKKFDSNSRLILTTEGMVTDPRSLNKLNELNMEVKIYIPNVDSKGFHLKTYLFETDNNTTLLIGSSNISARAFGLVHEMVAEINAKNEGYIIEKYNNTFNDLWNDKCSEVLTEEFIYNYSNIYTQNKKIEINVAKMFLEVKNIKPNYMQERALEALKECREVSNRGLVIAATGTGKTYLSAFDVKNCNAKKVLFLVHNRLILTSAIETYKKIFKNKTMIELDSNNMEKIHNFDFIFTTDKTAYNKLISNIPNNYFDYIIYDEAHKIGFDTKYRDIIDYFNPKFTLGITATPERTDNPDYLFKIFKYNIPYEIRLLDAMNHELVCPFTYYGLNLENKLLKSNEEFNYEELAKYIKNTIDKKGHYGEKLKCLVFCSNIKEANSVSSQLNNLGFISVSAVSGENELTRSGIEKYIIDLKSDEKGTLEIICTVNKFNEGIDIPDINTIIMLRNTISAIIYIQQLGRGLRRTEDPHKYVTVFDIIGNSKNNYSIAQVLTGNTTVDKRKLYMYANKGFETVSPFINVEIEKEAMEKIIRSISVNFTVKNELMEKFRNEFYRFEVIPTLKEMYLNPNFKEMELLQLLFKNFYEPFKEYYFRKYNIEKENKFLDNFFTLITQFVFRGYNSVTLQEYVKLLKGDKIQNDKLRKILLPYEFEDGISTAINSEYNKKGKEFPKIFEFENGYLKLNNEIVILLKKYKSIELFNEHIELFEYLGENNDYTMKLFDLVDKGEFLYNLDSKDCYMNVTGERIDKEKKTVYCIVKVTEKETFYDNYIVDNNKIIYYTKASKTKEAACEKIRVIIEENYKFYLCAQFPHLGYSNTSYFNLGNVKVNKISEVQKVDDGKYNHRIEFIVERDIPFELLQYK